MLTVLVFFAVTVGLTVLIEMPIIVRSRVTDSKAYICGVNIVTNVVLHLVMAGILLLSASADKALIGTLRTAWFILAELILIPVAEALAYRKISSAGTKRIFCFTYLANFASCAAGLVLEAATRYYNN